MGSEKRQPTLAMKRKAAQQRDRAQYGAKRDMILKAAGPVLERNGFAGTTIEAIAREAGLDRATVYYYFADKGAIFREAIHDGLAYMIAALEEVVRDGIKQGVFKTSLPPKVFAKAITGMLNWTSRWFVPDGVLDADDVADGMADTILNGVLVR